MARTSRTPAALLAVALAALGAGCDSVPSDAIEQCSASQVIPGTVATDILFVIDDSGSMAGEQATLQAGLAAFINDLAASPIANDYQIGVTTTSVVDFGLADDGTSGGALVSPGIMRPVPGDPNALITPFQAAVVVGISGASREQPFTAARRALEKSAPGGANEGFIRPGAKLAVIFLSDEDDCSGHAALTSDAECQAERTASPSRLVAISDVASALSAGGAREVVAAAIVGVAPTSLDLVCVTAAVCGAGPTTSCPTCCGTARYPGHRFVELLGALGQGSTRLASICDPTFNQALRDFATVILSQTLPLEGAPADWRLLVAHVDRGATSIPCTIAPADADPATRNAADAVYEPPLPGRPASLTFQNDCALQQDDRVFVDVVCAG
jgi:hypothetical protein